MLFTGRLRYLYFGLLLFVWCSCSNNAQYTNGLADKPTITKSSPADLLGSDAFYADTANYHQVFITYYNRALNEGNFEEAKNLLLNFGRVSFEVFDTSFVAIGTQFISSSFPVAIDSSYAMVCHFLSMNNYWGTHYPDMLFWAKKSLASCTLPEANRVKVLAYSDLGAAYSDMGEMDTAIHYFLAANEILTTQRDSVLMAQNYLDIGVCYFKLFATDECEKYFNLSSEIYLALKDTSNYLLNQTYFSLDAEPLAIDSLTMVKNLEESIDAYKQFSQKNSKDSFYLLLLLSKKCILEKKYAAAKVHLDECERINSTLPNAYMNDDWELLSMMYEMGTEGKIRHEAEVIATTDEMARMGNFSEAACSYNFLAKNAANKNDFREAFRFKGLEQKLKDKIQKQSTKSQLFEVEKKYQSEKKEQEIVLQKKTILSKNISIALLATSVAGLVLAGFVLQYRQRQKKLTQEKQNTLNYTRQLLQKTEEERKRIASDLHDSISHELLSLKTAVRTADTAVVNNKVDTIINDIRIISRNLHPVMFDKIGLQHSIEQMAERTQQQNNFMITADVDYTPGALPPSSELQVYRIVQEAVTNIIKYSQAIAGKIIIQQLTNTIKVEVKDNGKGFDVQEKLNNGEAFGLHNIIERSRAIGGVAIIESGMGGTIITINIPTT